MAKRIISVIIGVITGIIFIFIGDSVCMRLASPPAGLSPLDQTAYNNYVNSIPVYVMVIMFLFWMLSSFMGGLVSALINKETWKKSALITGSILLAASILNMVNVHHPVWMVVSAIALHIPVAFLGGVVVSRKKP